MLPASSSLKALPLPSYVRLVFVFASATKERVYHASRMPCVSSRPCMRSASPLIMPNSRISSPKPSPVHNLPQLSSIHFHQTHSPSTSPSHFATPFPLSALFVLTFPTSSPSSNVPTTVSELPNSSIPGLLGTSRC